MRPSEALAKHIDEVRAILARYPVRNPRVFGSVARGEDADASDLDILVDHDGLVSTFDLARLEIELERVLSTRVDIKTSGDFSTTVARSVDRDVMPIS